MRKLKTIYRLENAAGHGPYWGLHRDDWTDREHNDRNGCPGPYDDPAIAPIWSSLTHSDEYEQYKFGFASKKQYKRWFLKKEREALKKRGFKLVEINPRQCEDILISDYQVVFKEAA